MIAITFALPAESSGVVRKLDSKRSIPVNDVQVLFGKIRGRDMAIVHTGVGRARCRQTIGPFLKAIRPQFVISSGFAGSLTDELHIGDRIIAENFSDHVLSTQIVGDGPDIRRVKLLTVDQMVDSVEERARIAREDSAAAIDMETDVIVQACAKYNVPIVSLRVVSDSPASPFPAPAEVLFDLTRQQTDFGRLIPYVITHPSAIPRLWRFARQIGHARGILTHSLVNIISNTQLG